MDEETKKAIAEAKQNSTPENRAKAEEKICQNGANNKLSNLITNIRNKLKKSNLTKSEKEAVINEIIKFILADNKYQKEAYKIKRHEVDALLAELRGEKEKQEGISVTRLKYLELHESQK
ncbi:1437_t:CDS:2 [Paraglomus occultum]|uniref:1437_t:CDS:1 n=1 Tax=Paraglomus occultum TaxID=144539 RepID=A0A9N8VNW6_9GLOM|nr:1437_t:CDS:2 [Paraglomus occultum]